MQGPRNPRAERAATQNGRLSELHSWELQLTLPSLNEAIRLLESAKFEKLTWQHVHCIAEYRAIKIDEEPFFEKAFSTGKPVAVCLAFAMQLGFRDVREDMARLRLTLLDPM